MVADVSLNRGVQSRPARLVRWLMVVILAGIAVTVAVVVISTGEGDGPDVMQDSQVSVLRTVHIGLSGRVHLTVHSGRLGGDHLIDDTCPHCPTAVYR